MKKGYVSGIYEFTVPERIEGVKSISYSQFSMWSTCPKQWKLTYIDKLGRYEDSIHTLFGSAFHETMQHFLHVLYTDSVKAANSIDLPAYLRERMSILYVESLEKNGGVHYTDQSVMEEFYSDGVAILDYFQKHRLEYFSTNGYELVAIEMPIWRPVSDVNSKVYMSGYIDIILRDTISNRLIIYDIKTSTNGWNKYQKADFTKVSQVVLYKKYIAEQLNHPIELIDTKYFIVKRKLVDGFAYPQKRITEFSPPSGKPTVNKLMTQINEFIKSGFTEEGDFNVDGNFPATAGPKAKNCKYCIFLNEYNVCPKEIRIKE